MNLRSLIIAVLVVLAGCATPPRAPVEVAPVIVPASTWQQVDREIVAASQSATEQTRIYARGAMEYWRTRVYELTEENFIPWFSSYWTQEWLSMKVSWYTISAKGEQDASAKRLAAYLLEAYQEKVLAPVAAEIDPDAILGLAAAFYVDILKEELQKISTRHGVPMAQLNGRIQKIPAIALGPPPARDASLYQIVHTESLTTLPAYAALLDKIHKAGKVFSCSVCTIWYNEAFRAGGGPSAMAGIFWIRPLSWAIGTPWRVEIFCSSSLRMST